MQKDLRRNKYIEFQNTIVQLLWRVYKCRFDNQVPIKVTPYIVYEEDRKPAQNWRHKIWVSKVGNPFSQASGFVPGLKTVKHKCGIHETIQVQFYTKLIKYKTSLPHLHAHKLWILHFFLTDHVSILNFFDKFRLVINKKQ